MQIECREGAVLKLAGVGTEAEEGRAKVRQRESMVEDGVKEGAKWGSESGAGRTGAERGEPCRVFELWASCFMAQ